MRRAEEEPPTTDPRHDRLEGLLAAAVPPEITRRPAPPVSLTIMRLDAAARVERFDSLAAFQLALQQAGKADHKASHAVIDYLPTPKLKAVAREGGLYRYLEIHHGPGRYKVLWNGDFGDVLRSAEFVVPDLEAVERDQREAEERVREEQLESERMAQRAQAEDDFVSYWTAYGLSVASRRAGDLFALEARVSTWLRDRFDTLRRLAPEQLEAVVTSLALSS